MTENEVLKEITQVKYNAMIQILAIEQQAEEKGIARTKFKNLIMKFYQKNTRDYNMLQSVII